MANTLDPLPMSEVLGDRAHVSDSHNPWAARMALGQASLSDCNLDKGLADQGSTKGGCVGRESSTSTPSCLPPNSGKSPERVRAPSSPGNANICVWGAGEAAAPVPQLSTVYLLCPG